MKHSLKTRFLALLLAVVMVIGLVPMTTFATEEDQSTDVLNEAAKQSTEADPTEADPTEADPTEADPTEADPSEASPEPEAQSEEPRVYNGGLDLNLTDCGYYNLIESDEYALAPGATEYQYILNDDTGSRRQVVHVIEVDTSNPNISVMPSFKNISTDVDYTDQSNWGAIGVTKHAAHAEENLGKNVVGGMNVSLSWDFTYPYGLLIYEGVVLYDDRDTHPGGGYLVIDKDGKAELRDAKAPLTGDEWMAQTVCFSFLVRDGVNLAAKEDHTTAGDPRSVIGIKADGTLVLMMVDGRMAPYSEGFTSHEMAEMMIALGCVDAINCDGGGSSTFITEREGTGSLSVKSRFSDGSERNTLTAILVVSNATADGQFDHASVESSEKYVTPGSTVTLKATGADASGAPADIPHDVVWQLEDPSMGTVENGVFTSNGKVGTAVVQLVYNNQVVGEDSIEVVIPDSLEFVQVNMTVPYDKSISLDLIAKYGYNEVTLKDEDVTFVLSNDAIGSILGTTFTATSDEAFKEPATITATLVHDTQLTATGNITLGRASVIVYDFESGAESIANWSLAYKAPYTPDKYYFNDELSVVSAEDGKVMNGNYALKVTADGDSIICMNWCQTRINGLGIDLTDAVSLSFWMYIPEGSHGYEWDFGNAIPVVLGHEYKYGTGWQYFTVNVADIGTNVTSIDQIRLYHSDTNNEAIGYLHNEKPNYYADVVYYIDDITVNYSSAVDDNMAPVISNATVSYEGIDTGVAMTGQTIFSNTVAFTAAATDDYSGLDTDTVAVYVDGNQVNAVCSDTGMVSTGDITLANGGHVVRIEISDKAGNRSSFYEYYFVLAGENTQNTINYVPADPTLTDVPVDSLVWMNLEATAIESVDNVVTVIDLDQNNKWDLDHMELADGFEATYSVDSESNDATITITRTGTVNASGNAVLASLPIRVWSPAYPRGSNEDTYSYRLVAVVSHVEEGILNETTGSKIFFGSLPHTTLTEYNSTRLTSTVDKGSWHAHTVVELEDTDATCTTNGYKGRTFCEECNSVVTWGTTLPATGHSFNFDENHVLKCTCGELFTGTHTDGIEYVEGIALIGWVGNSYYLDGQKITGIHKVPAPDETGEEYYYNFGEDGECKNQAKFTGMFQEDGLNRYAYIGVLTSGWQTVNDEWYYFSSSTMAAVSGTRKINGVYFEFDDNGKLVSGVWVKTLKGTRYYFGPTYYESHWKEIEGEMYFFENGYRLEGYHYVATPGGRNIKKWYDFGEDGIAKEMQDGIWEINGNLYYFLNGEFQTGLQKVGEDYYFFLENGTAIVDQSYYAYETKCDLPVATYAFGADGKMLNGIIETANGYFYYENGQVGNAYGLLKIDGNYYFALMNGKLVTSQTYYAWESQCDLPTGEYYFDEEGKLANGIVETANGPFFYTNGKTGIEHGLLKIDGDYYFALMNGKLITNQTYYAYETSCDLPTGNYEFGADGKMLQGIVETANGYYYYVNGKAGREFGLVNVDGDYYFALMNGKLITDQVYYAWETNCDLPKGNYEFGADGKMTSGIVQKADGYYFYTNGKAGREYGLVKIGEDYYFALMNGKLITSQVYYAWETYCDLPTGNYEFGADGKMLQGIVEKADGYYYYVNGKAGREYGLLEINGDYYFVLMNGKLITSQVYYAWETYCDLPTGNYEFGADGKMLQGVVEKTDGYYYYTNGKAGREHGLIKVGEDYYFVLMNGKLITNQVYYAWETYCDLPKASYEFGADGKMLNGIVEKADGYYYYTNGKAGGTYGLFMLDGHYYFALMNGKLITGQKYHVWESNGLLLEGEYTFDEYGRIVG